MGKREVIRFNPQSLANQGIDGHGEKSQLELKLDESYYSGMGERKKVIIKKAVGGYFVQLYAAIFGGDVSPDVKNNYEYYANGYRKFHPDITRRTKVGVHYTEVKAASNTNQMNWLGVRQLENYAHHYLQWLEEGLSESSVEYTFFRYGPYNYNSSLKLSSLKNDQLKKELSNDQDAARRDLLVMPLNLLLLFILSTSKYHTQLINQETSTSGVSAANYWIVGPGGISRLHKGLDSLDYFLEHAFVKGSRELFMLDSLSVEKSATPERVYCGRYKVRPFSVTRYSLEKEQLLKWNAHFFEAHEEIFRHLGIKDLHKEQTSARDEACLDDEDWAMLVSGKNMDLSSLGIDLSDQKVPF